MNLVASLSNENEAIDHRKNTHTQTEKTLTENRMNENENAHERTRRNGLLLPTLTTFEMPRQANLIMAPKTKC